LNVVVTVRPTTMHHHHFECDGDCHHSPPLSKVQSENFKAGKAKIVATSDNFHAKWCIKSIFSGALPRTMLCELTGHSDSGEEEARSPLPKNPTPALGHSGLELRPCGFACPLPVSPPLLIVKLLQLAPLDTVIMLALCPLCLSL